MVKNGNITFLLLELILADQLADLPLVEASSGQEWQYYISTFRAHIGRSTGQEWQYEISTFKAHIGRSTGRSSATHWQIYPLVEASSGQEWQYEISTVSSYWQIKWQIYPPW